VQRLCFSRRQRATQAASRYRTVPQMLPNCVRLLATLTTSRGQLKCDGTRAETRFRLSAKRTSPFKSAGASVLSTTGSRGVRINGSNAAYTMFRGSVKSTGYTLHSPVSPFTSPPVRHHVQSHFSWSLQRGEAWELGKKQSCFRNTGGGGHGKGKLFCFPIDKKLREKFYV